ncbi:MAG: DUF3685 domain-containing protein [Pseudanabaena frigida]|uniref:DUF3685 domain-containing protein n=1 Tax=Pseudanabaena frigida TaxID=945775 RepID=A0A2W4VY74_9CYAN|nr:MAG: DUF3685 domain-containing protein [Pseudanabaena frigida]
MNDELYKLLLIDGDRIFRMGMRSWLVQFSDLEIVGEADNAEEALAFLQGTTGEEALNKPDVDLVILDLQLGAMNSKSGKSKYLSGLDLCQELKSQYPDLPILLLSSLQSSELVETALRNGIDGFCLKGTNPEELIRAIRQTASGNPYLGDIHTLEVNQPDRTITDLPDEPVSVVAILKHNFYLSGLRRIDNMLDEVQKNLNNSDRSHLSDRLTKIVLAGQIRELKAARWLINQLWATNERARVLPSKTTPNISMAVVNSTVEISDCQINKPNILEIQSSLWDTTVAKLQASLSNLSKTPLEIDILKDEKKRELLYVILRQVEQSITELRLSEVQPSQLEARIPNILKNIWQETVINFFGKYYTLSYTFNSNHEVNVVDVLLEDIAIVQTEFLDKIPQIDNLLSHLLFESELIINNSSVAIGSPEAMQRAELILDNLIIQIANGVIQPLLNHFANIEEIKQKFYRYNLLATREVERFRNDLSWKYRLEKYITDPQLIFESRHLLLTLANPGIKRISIYAPRNQELQQLEGVQLAVTLVLELQDAIAPRLKSAIAFLGSGFVYVLTNVIGRGIGLIGRGVVQGIGNAWQDSRKN